MDEERKELLAKELAETFDEPDKLPLYRSFVEQVPEAALRDLAQRVLARPVEKIYTTRARYFNSLVQQYVQSHRPRA